MSNEEKTNDYENFEKGMIYMKILKKGGVVEKRGEEETKSMPHAPVIKPFNTMIEQFFWTVGTATGDDWYYALWTSIGKGTKMLYGLEPWIVWSLKK